MKQKNVWKRRLSVFLIVAMMLNMTIMTSFAEWKQEDGKWYFYKENGNKVSGGAHKILKEGWYYFDEDGVMLSDQLVEENGIKFYASPKSEGKLTSGWALLDDEGKKCTHSGNDLENHNCKWYYFEGVKENGEGEIVGGGMLRDGMFKIVNKVDNGWYYFDKDGAMAHDEFIEIDGSLMYARSDGSLADGMWLSLKEQDPYRPDRKRINWYRFKKIREENGKVKGGAIRDDIFKEKNDCYAFDTYGRMICDDWFVDNAGNLQGYFQRDGKMVSSKWLPMTGENLWYEFNKDGKAVRYAQVDEDGEALPIKELRDLATAPTPYRKVVSIEPVKETAKLTAGEGKEVKVDFKVNLATNSNAKSDKLTKDHQIWAEGWVEEDSSGEYPVRITDEDNHICTVTVTYNSSNHKIGDTEEVYLVIDNIDSSPALVEVISSGNDKEDTKNEISSVLDFDSEKELTKEDTNRALNSLKDIYDKEEKKEVMQKQWLNPTDDEKKALDKLEDAYIKQNKIERLEPHTENVKELLGEDVSTSIKIVRGDGLNGNPNGTVQLKADAPKDEKWKENEDWKKVNGNYEKTVAFDLTFAIDGENASSLNIPIIISMKIPAGFSAKNLEMFNLHEGTLIPLLTEVKNGSVSFVTDRFSTYVFAGKNDQTGSEPGNPGSNTTTSSRRSPGTTKESSMTMNGKWIAGENSWKFLKDNGEYATNTWGYVSGKWYFFDAQGNMVTGWYMINNQWYYLNPAEGSDQGAMVTGWNFDPAYNSWFYLNENGAMLDSWQEISGKWYYFNPISDGTKGSMAANTYVDGYYVGADGAWVK